MNFSHRIHVNRSARPAHHLPTQSRSAWLRRPAIRNFTTTWACADVQQHFTNTAKTIFALSTAVGRSAIAIIRISGPDAIPATKKLLGTQTLPSLRSASKRKILHPKTSETIDEGLVLIFSDRKSVTGESVVELHLHGSRAVVSEVLELLGTLPGLRPADAGEFTKRAFLNGKLDLTEVEGLADLLAAETQQQRRQALRQYSGELSKLYSGWIEELKQAAAHVEAAIDFMEEDETIEKQFHQKVQKLVSNVESQIRAHLNDNRRGERLRGGASVTIVGPPNAGKSSLINLLAQRRVAIVSEIPGTTRDVIETVLDIGGYPVVLADTAGLRHTSDSIEKEGVALAKEKSESSDIRLCVLDASEVQKVAADSHVLSQIFPNTLVVLNKTDLLNEILPKIPAELQKALDAAGCQNPILVSTKTSEGLLELTHALQEQLTKLFRSDDLGAPALTRSRHRAHLTRCASNLQAFLEQPNRLEFAAEHLHQAMRDLGRITGRVDIEDILDVLFKDFCIGK